MIEFRNARFVDDLNNISCEILVDGMGWVPNTIDRLKRSELYEQARLVATAYVPPEVPDPLIELRAYMSLTFSQTLIGLVTEGWISMEDGESWLDGVIPSNVQSLINNLPTPLQRFEARARVLKPSVILRNDPIVNSLATLENKTPEDIDQFFTTYGSV